MIKYTPQQEEAIKTIDENLQIIACAGSGKTQVISQRVVTILKEKKDIEPKNIIAFTYTEKAAAELKTRILKLCREQLEDTEGLAEMYVGTIHSWCLQAIQDNVYEYQKYSVLDEVKQKLFIDKYYQKTGMAQAELARYKDTGRFITMLSVLREAELVDGQELPEEWVNAMKMYENQLRSHSYFDFTMIMTEAIKSLRENPAFREQMDNQLKYLIVDEYQDVNPIQETLIQELTKSGCNICVVGDDDQTIYQWRGGDVQYIQKFQERYNDVKYIKLEDNFRSTPGVIDVALKCITNNTQRLPKVMKASGHQEYAIGDLVYNQYDDIEDETEFIVETIKKLRGASFKDKLGAEERGLDYSDFTVLLRTWKKAKEIMEELTLHDIPFIVGGVNELFQRPEIKACVAIYNFLYKQIDPGALKAYWMNVSEEIEEAKIDEAIKWLEKKVPTEKTFFASFSIQDVFWNFIEKANLREEIFEDEDHGGVVGNDINEVIYYNLGMFSQIIDDFETIHFKDKPGYKLKLFLNFIKYTAEGYYPEGWLNNSYKTPNAVQIMTIFQSKGLEFPVVFVPGLNKNYLPIQKPTGFQAVTSKAIQALPIKNVERYLSQEEDERRLMYVAVTRAQKYLFVTRAVESKMRQKESLFAKEISNSDFLITDPNPDYSTLSQATPQPKSEMGAVQLNFSILRDYFDCPYRFKLITLYGWVQPLTETMGYGNSVHNILMELHREHLAGEEITDDYFNEVVDRQVFLPYASDKMFERIYQTAKKATRQYLDENRADFDKIEYAEKDIQLDLGDGILVNGRMDMIKKVDLAGTEVTTIVDFKSSKEAQRENLTMDQLALYALGYKELSGKTADFLQIFNLDENQHSKTTQKLDNTQMDNIKTKLVDSANEIRQNNLEKTCEASTCSNCYYVQLCSGAKAS